MRDKGVHGISRLLNVTCTPLHSMQQQQQLLLPSGMLSLLEQQLQPRINTHSAMPNTERPAGPHQLAVDLPLISGRGVGGVDDEGVARGHHALHQHRHAHVVEGDANLWRGSKEQRGRGTRQLFAHHLRKCQIAFQCRQPWYVRQSKRPESATASSGAGGHTHCRTHRTLRVDTKARSLYLLAHTVRSA